MMLIQGILCINGSTNNNREVNKQKTAAAVL